MGVKSRPCRQKSGLPTFAEILLSTVSVDSAAPRPILLLTPPFTQLNTPYPATAYLKGFLNTRGILAVQGDLGLDVLLTLFSAGGLAQAFAKVEATELSDNAERIFALRSEYGKTIDPVMRFLQGFDPTLARSIAARQLLPEAGRFEQTADLESAFGTMGIQDKARHLATLYLEDLSDFIKEAVDPHFGFSRYAEKLSAAAASFDGLEDALQQPLTLVDAITIQHLGNYMEAHNPALVAFSIPFPGNLFAALRCGQWMKKHHPEIPVVIGGGYPNTELRSLKETRLFQYLDFVTLDDGEAPVEALYNYVLAGESGDTATLKRTFLLEGGEVIFKSSSACKDYAQSETGTPDYRGLRLNEYVSVIEVTNPMHSLWSDGRWNKLTMAHGCYWGKCTFCDVTLPYIADYEPVVATMLADRMEQLVAQTGQTGFHFVDEAAPPALMRNLALEILRRRMVVSWWANVRFEKSFTPDLCRLLRASGCIAISGGLEVASDRLLKLIDKGISVAQVARVNRAFTDSGILVHAYLMYGFPTQTAGETVDSLEMVRQLFAAGVLQSAFWHRFALTFHAPVAREPERFGVVPMQAEGAFANNEVAYEEPGGTDHDAFGWGLRKSLFNFMHGVGLEEPVHKWFEEKVPRTTIAPDWIQGVLEVLPPLPKPTARVLWTGGGVRSEVVTKSKKGRSWEEAVLTLQTPREEVKVRLPKEEGLWLAQMLPRLAPEGEKPFTRAEVEADFLAAGGEDFSLFWDGKGVSDLGRVGLLQV